MKGFLRRNIYQLIITAVVVLLGILNYTPDTYLTGWDTLHPEFDFALNFKRLLAGVWRQEQGLGALAGHSHMADLPRVFIMWILHFAFPINMLKYLYLFICLLLGPLGMFYLVKHLLETHKTRSLETKEELRGATADHWHQRKFSHVGLVAFLTALFYLFNLSTLQQFYLPFEMFPTQYAFLPWIILFSLGYLYNSYNDYNSYKKRRKYLFLFCLATLFAAPQAYAAHLWYPFFGVYCLFLMTYVFLQRTSYKKALVLVLLTCTVNAFWLLPNVYFILKGSSVPKQAKQNRIYSQEYLLRNRENGYIADVALGRGFYFNWTIYDFEKERFAYIMEPWRDYHKKFPVEIVGYSLFIFSAAGLFFAVKRRQLEYLALSPFFVVSFVILMNHTLPFDIFFNLLLKISILEEALRFVFTKFSILLVFSYSIFLSLTLAAILERKRKKMRNFISISIVAALIIYCLPMFNGQLISPKLKVKIPDSYFQLWDYMKKQPAGLTLSLPVYNFSGWQYYDWGYQGSGFLWFGLPQSLLDRDSDRWSVSNEQAFREIQYSLYTKNPSYLMSSLDKYQVGYLIWDKSVISALVKNRDQITFKRETESLIEDLSDSGYLSALTSFGTINVYKINRPTLVSEKKKIANVVAPLYHWNAFDTAHYLLEDYISLPSTTQQFNNLTITSSHFFPFRGLITASDRVKKELFEIDSAGSSYYLKTDLQGASGALSIPDYISTEEALYTNLYVQRAGLGYTLIFDPLLPKGLVSPISYQAPLISTPDNQNINFTFNTDYFSFRSETVNSQTPLYLGQALVYTRNQNYLNGSAVHIPLSSSQTSKDTAVVFSKFPLKHISLDAQQIYKTNEKEAEVELEKDDGETFVAMTSKNSQTGAYIDLSPLPHHLGYILIINSRNVEGMPIRVCLQNLYTKICSFYDELTKSDEFADDYFFIPPAGDGLGYGLSLDNISYGNYEAKNHLKKVTILALPYTFLSQLRYESPAQKPHNLHILYQSFNPGWKAYEVKRKGSNAESLFPFLFGKELKNHVLVNNWANAWVLPETKTPKDEESIVTVFWPQYLQYLGYVLLFGSLVMVLKKRA